METATKPSISISRYGWRPQLPDQRDVAYNPSADQLSAAESLISSSGTVDLRTSGFMPEPYDQGQLGSCTANAGAGDMEYTANKLGLSIGGTPSRLFIYYNERVLQGTVDSDSGATLRESMKATNKYGAPPESEWPYDVAKFKDAPPASDFTNALQDLTLKYSSVKRDENYFVASLLDGKGVRIGFTVYESFEQDIGSNGIMPMPAKSESVLGGHAVYVVGFCFIVGSPYWIVRNSWGTSWADGGYFYMPMRYLLSASLSSDFWHTDLQGAQSS